MLVTKPYRRERAVAYAAKYAFSQNPLFGNFAGFGGNCTNFVSQCIYAGSCKMNYTQTFGWYFISLDERSPSWTGVEYFYNFMTTNGGVGPFGRQASADELEIGDVVQLAKADGVTLDIKVEIKTNNTGDYKLGLVALKEWGAQSIFMTNEGVVNEVFPEVSNSVAAYKDILFCGFDAGTNQYNWMKDAGKTYALLVGSVAQDSYSIGYKAVELAAKKLAGEDVADVGIAGVWYNAQNIDEQRDKNIFYMG